VKSKGGFLENNESFSRSPLMMKGGSSVKGSAITQRVCFTDQKVTSPFKNTTNDRSNIIQLQTFNTERKNDNNSNAGKAYSKQYK
jgi:hypothetical protein